MHMRAAMHIRFGAPQKGTEEGMLAARFNSIELNLALTSSRHYRVSDGADLLHMRHKQLQGPTRQRSRPPVGTCSPSFAACVKQHGATCMYSLAILSRRLYCVAVLCGRTAIKMSCAAVNQC
jgi:hypothetical protein